MILNHFIIITVLVTSVTMGHRDSDTTQLSEDTVNRLRLAEERGRRHIANDEEVTARRNLMEQDLLARLAAKDAERRRLLPLIEDEASCAICMENFKLQDLETINTTPCRHLFHDKCIDMLRGSELFRRDPKCPMCRVVIPRAAGDEGPVQVAEEEQRPPPVFVHVIGRVDLQDGRPALVVGVTFPDGHQIQRIAPIFLWQSLEENVPIMPLVPAVNIPVIGGVMLIHRNVEDIPRFVGPVDL